MDLEQQSEPTAVDQAPVDSENAPASEPAEHENDDNAPSMVKAVVKEILQIIVPAVVLAIVIHLFLAQATVVFGQSMEPNLHPQERLVIEKVSYRFHTPERFDIVVIDLPQMNELLIKRVIGLPGETIEIRRGIIYINGQPLKEPVKHGLDGATYPPTTLPPMSYFVLGDNRGNSNDSRVFGPVRLENIVGKAWLRYWPIERITRF
jgi:signal peptidase I